jgi:hypothetical protein
MTTNISGELLTKCQAIAKSLVLLARFRDPLGSQARDILKKEAYLS